MVPLSQRYSSHSRDSGQTIIRIVNCDGHIDRTSFGKKGCHRFAVNNFIWKNIVYKPHTVDGRNPAPPWMIETL
jgi:hypothetical protein